MYVCLSVTKVIILYSKDLVVPHVSRHIPYSKYLVVSMFLDTFCIEGIWSFPCFLTLLYSKDLVVSHVYRHLVHIDTRLWPAFGRQSLVARRDNTLLKGTLISPHVGREHISRPFNLPTISFF